MYNIVMNKVKNYCHYLLESSVQNTLEKKSCVISIVIPWFKFQREAFWNELTQICTALNDSQQKFSICLPMTFCPKLSNKDDVFDYYDFINKESIDEFHSFLNLYTIFQERMNTSTQIWQCSFNHQGKYTFLDLNKQAIHTQRMFLEYYQESAQEKLANIEVCFVHYASHDDVSWELNEFEEKNGYLFDRRVDSVPLMVISENLNKRDLFWQAELTGLRCELKKNYSFQYIFSDFFSYNKINSEIKICMDATLSKKYWDLLLSDFLSGKTLVLFDSALTGEYKILLEGLIKEHSCLVEKFSYFVEMTHVFKGEGHIIILKENDLSVLAAAEKSQFWNKFFLSLNSNLICIRHNGDWDGNLVKFKSKTDTFSLKEKTILNLVPRANAGDIEFDLKENHVFLTSDLHFDQIRVNKRKINIMNVEQSFYIELGFS